MCNRLKALIQLLFRRRSRRAVTVDLAPSAEAWPDWLRRDICSDSWHPVRNPREGYLDLIGSVRERHRIPRSASCRCRSR